LNINSICDEERNCSVDGVDVPASESPVDDVNQLHSLVLQEQQKGMCTKSGFANLRSNFNGGGYIKARKLTWDVIAAKSGRYTLRIPYTSMGLLVV